jgi:hypothetical protein
MNLALKLKIQQLELGGLSIESLKVQKCKITLIVTFLRYPNWCQHQEMDDK